jgi:hypothetical protein
MALEETKQRGDAVIAQDVAVLRQYGLRWAVLAAWRDALKLRRVAVPPEADRVLESVRIKIASGCFSACEVGSDLMNAEGVLTIADGSTDHNWVDFWLDLLAHSMSEGAEIDRLMKVPSIKFRYNNCGSSACRG